MEIRCESCKKLFRVADEKITGTGIKFACTRCGEMVKVTKEEFEQYTLSKTAVSALDMFEPKPKTKPAPTTLIEVPTAPPPPAQPAPAPAESIESSIPDFLQEQSPFAEPSSLEEALPSFDSAPPAQVEPTPTPIPEPIQKAPQPEVMPAVKPEPNPEVRSGPTIKPVPASVRKEQAPVVPFEEIQETPPLAEPVKATAETKAPPIKRSRSGKLILTVLIAIMVLGGAGYGVYFYVLQAPPPPQPTAPPVLETVSIAGLQITNPTGYFEKNGDLFITGTVENSTDVARPAWYVVADILDAQGTVLARARVVNGKQAYTKRDYDILAQRGVNVQELKAKDLQDHGTVVPPRGKVTFVLHYLQPPVGTANFLVTLQPFDPVRLYKEIEDQAK